MKKRFLGLETQFLCTKRGLDNVEAEMTEIENILIYFKYYSLIKHNYLPMESVFAVQKSGQIDFLTSKVQLVPLADNVTDQL